jgi:hypothetical protein
MDVSEVPLVSSILVSTVKAPATITPIARLWNVDVGTSVEAPEGPVPVSGVALDQHTRAVEPGGYFQLSATVYPLYAANKNVTWDSSDSAIATVSAGLVSAIADGSATITVTTEDGAFTDSCVVTVMTGVVQVQSVTVTPHNHTLTHVDAPYQLQADVLPANATDKSVTWQSSDIAVAEVSASGLVTPVAIGTVTVTASVGGMSDTCVITVISGDAETPNITGQPQNRNYAKNAVSDSLTVVADVGDGGDLTYQWYSNDANSNIGGNPLGAANGAQTANYTPPTATLGTVYYYCVVTNTNSGVNGNQTAATPSNTACIIVINDATLASITASPNGVISPTFIATTTSPYGVTVPAYADTVTFTATPTNTAAKVEYALDASDIFSETTRPVATLNGLSGSVIFRVKVTTPTMDHIWGPYTFNVTRAMAYTIGGGLVYETFEGDDYEGIKFTEGTGTFTVDASASPGIDLLVVGGGGGGGGGRQAGSDAAGGGGAGGLIYEEGFAVQQDVYTVSIGDGGGGGNPAANGDPGGASVFYLASAGDPAAGLTANGAKAPGGGYGGGANSGGGNKGGDGGSGGGGGAGGNSAYGLGGSANGGDTVTGYDGAQASTSMGGGGGGGAAGPGNVSSNGTAGGTGGTGLWKDIAGVGYTYARGGNGGTGDNSGLVSNGLNFGDGGYGNGGGGTSIGGTGKGGIVVIRWAK